MGGHWTGRDDSIAIRADGEIHFGHLQAGESLAPASTRKRHWIHLISGALTVEGESLEPGDGGAIEGDLPDLESTEESSFFLFSL